MKVEDGIKALGGMFREMKVEAINNEPVVYVVVAFPENWRVNVEETKEKFNVSYALNENLSYFFASLDTGSELVFDAVLFNMKRNQEAQERYDMLQRKKNELSVLFQVKSKELEELFKSTEYSTEELGKMNFTVNGMIEKRIEEKKDEDIVEEKLEEKSVGKKKAK